MKPRIIAATFTLLLIAFISFAFVNKQQSSTSYVEAGKQIVLREIGHRLLLIAGDSTSRVLPIKQLSENEYQVQFGSSFSFTPDLLVKTINSSMQAGKMPANYVVNVVDKASNQIIYGYSIAQSSSTNIVACSGRKQPEAMYYVNIIFPPATVSAFNKAAPYSVCILLAVIPAFFIFGNKTKTNTVTAPENVEPKSLVNIGDYEFYHDRQLLIFQQQETELTSKESKLLQLLAHSPNELIGRKQLLKIWEDEGVIVGRSLDVFISKLRKKLQDDPAIKLVNIHGRGYKLEISEQQ